MSKILIDKIQRKSVWKINRFKSEKDWEDKKIYRKEEALEMFGVSQFSIVQGGLMGAFGNLSLLREKFGKVSMKDFFGSMAHLFGGNVLLNEGINELWTIACSASSGTKFDNSNAYLGVGDSSTAEDAAQTGLQAVTNKFYKAMDASYPTYGTAQKATWVSTFESADANFDWRVFTVANGNSDSAINLNRKVSSQGTKVSGQQWELVFEISLS